MFGPDPTVDIGFWFGRDLAYPHQLAVFDNIGRKDRREPPLDAVLGHTRPVHGRRRSRLELKFDSVLSMSEVG